MSEVMLKIGKVGVTMDSSALPQDGQRMINKLERVLYAELYPPAKALVDSCFKELYEKAVNTAMQHDIRTGKRATYITGQVIVSHDLDAHKANMDAYSLIPMIATKIRIWNEEEKEKEKKKEQEEQRELLKGYDMAGS